MKKDDLIEIVIVALVVVSLLGLLVTVRAYQKEKLKQEILKELK
jgi:ABC-type Na+ efflux pump permease subunit